MRSLLALLLVLLLAAPAHAQGAPFVTTVAQGDADLNLELRTARVTIGYVDANGNARPDTQPDEMLYLDLDASSSVTYGDLRLSRFDTYAAGTAVNLTNHDVGRPLTAATNAWFAQAGSAWVLDVDNSGSITAGDVAFAAAPAKVMPGDARVGQSLARPSGTPTNSYGWTTQGGRDVTRTFYVDLDGFTTGGSRTSIGDLRVTPLGLAPDNAPTRAEFEQAKQAMAQRQEEQKEAVVEETSSSAPAAWRALDWFVVGLAVLNLAGLVAIARRVNQLRGPPKNPFK